MLAQQAPSGPPPVVEEQSRRLRRRSYESTEADTASIAESLRSTEAIRVLRRPYLAGGYRPPPPVGNPAAWDIGTGLRMQRLPTHEETAYLERKKQQEPPMFHLPNIERR
jgi:hypothetical protein